MLNLTNGSKVYSGGKDADGKGFIKFGTKSVAGTIKFTVPADVVQVELQVAKYKANTSKCTVNGTAYTLNKDNNSKNGVYDYDSIIVDTSETKTVTVATASGGYRMVMYAIIYYGSASAAECDHTYDEGVVTHPSCYKGGYTTYTCSKCGDTYTDNETPATKEHIAGAAATCTTAQVCTTEGCGHVFVLPSGVHNYVNAVCSTCGGEGAEGTLVATFTFPNGEAIWEDGELIEASANNHHYTSGNYELTFTGIEKAYAGARDDSGKGIIKFGTSSVAGKLQFTVPENIDTVCLHVANYKSNVGKCTVNGSAHTTTKSSNNTVYDYDVIVVDTSETKTVAIETVSGGYRMVMYAIELYEAAAPECNHEYEFACSTECNKCGEGEREAAHAYKYDCSTTCKYCYEGEREVTHTYEYDCSTECKVCHKETRPEAKHTYVDGVCACGDGALVSPITLDIANGAIIINADSFTQGDTTQAYTGSYILTGTATAEQYYNISISGVADGATITLKDLDIASNGPNPLAFTGAVTVTATGTIELDYAYGGALTSSADGKVTILGDADIIASAPYGAISNRQWDITCNSLTLESTTSPAVYVSELTVCAAEDIKVTSTGGNAINCTNGGQGNATLTAGGDITLIGNNSYTVNAKEVALDAAGDITVTTSGSSTPAIDADKVSMTSTAGSISATNDSFMVFRQYTSLTLAANNNITVTGNGSSPAVSAPELSMTATNGDISVTSSGGMAIGANTSATLVAGGDITATGNSQSPAVSASELSMTATNGDISVTSSGGMAISANTSATLVAGGDITATGNGSAPAVYAAEASVTAGNLKIENKGTGMAVAGVLEANAENITMATQGAALYSQTPALNYTVKLTEITSAGTIVTCKHPSYQDGICTGCGAPAAAMIGDKAFDSLQAALDAAKSGDTIKVLVDATVAAGETIKLDGVKLIASEGVKLTNNGTILVSGSSDISAKVTGDGWVYMNGVTMTADTKLIGAKVGFINGTNTIVGSTIDDGWFSVGIGQNAAAATTAEFAAANGITLGDVTVNVSGNAVIGGNGKTYSGWVGSAYSADKTQHKYTLNIENSQAAFGYLHVSADGTVNVKGHTDNKYIYDGSKVDFYAGDFIINGTATFDGSDAWGMYTKISPDSATGILNIVNGANYEASIHNGGNTGNALTYYKKGAVNVEKATLYVRNITTIVADAALNITDATLTTDGTLTNNGTVTVSGESTLNIPTLSGSSSIDLLDGAIIKDSTVGGDGSVDGNVTFRGNNTFNNLYDFGDYYFKETPSMWTVEKGASLTLTNSVGNPYGLGYGDNVTVNGSLENALTARETLTEGKYSFYAEKGIRLSTSAGNDAANGSFVTVNNAYAVIGKIGSFSNSKTYGKFTIALNNSVIDAAQIFFSDSNDVIDLSISGSDVLTGIFMTADKDSTYAVNNSKMVVTASGNDRYNGNDGALTVKNSTIEIKTGTYKNNGTLTLDAASCLTAPSITGEGTIIIDATGLEEGKAAKVIDQTNGTSLEGKVTVNNLPAGTTVSYADGDVTLTRATAVATIGGDRYFTLQAAVDAAVDGNTITMIDDITEELVTINKAVTLNGNDYTLTGNVNLNGASLTDCTIRGQVIADGEVTLAGNNDISRLWITGDNAVATIPEGATLTVNTPYPGILIVGATETDGLAKNYFTTTSTKGGKLVVTGTLNSEAVGVFGNGELVVGGEINAPEFYTGKDATDTTSTAGKVTIAESGALQTIFCGLGGETNVAGTLTVKGASGEHNFDAVMTVKSGAVLNVTGKLVSNRGIAVEENATVNVDSGAVEFKDLNGNDSKFSGKLTNNGDINADITSSVIASSIVGDGNITIDATGLTGEVNVINLSSGEAPAVKVVGDAVATYGEDGDVTLVPAVAKVGTTCYATLADAVAEAKSGDTITLFAGEYELPLFSNKELTFKGEDKATVIINDAPAGTAQNWFGSSFHFENLTAKGATAIYHGLANGVKTVTYKDCNVNNLRFLYAETVSFENCAFNSGAQEHSFWTYGASNVTVTGCTFEYADRAVNCYSESGAEHETSISFSDCEFVYTGNKVDPEGAVEINSGFVKSISVDFDKCTAPENGAMWFNSQWDSTGGEKTEVEVENVKVWPIYVAQIGENGYITLEKAFNAAADRDTVKLLADFDLGETALEINKAITLDTNGHKLTAKEVQLNNAGAALVAPEGMTVITNVPGKQIAYSNAESTYVVADIKLNASNMTLGNTLGLNFLVEVDQVKNADEVVAVLTRDDVEVKRVTLSDTENVKKVTFKVNNVDVEFYQICYDGIAAKEMNDEVTMQLFDQAGNEVSNKWTDSAVEYAKFMLARYEAGKESEELAIALVDMLNYGAAAQKAFGYNTDNLANSFLTAKQQELATKNYGKNGDNVLTDAWKGNGIGYGSNLELKENIILHIWFKSAGVDKAVITYTDHYGDNKSTTVEAKDFTPRMTGVSSVAVDTLVVADGYQLVKVELYKGGKIDTVEESIESYLAYMLSKDSDNALYDATAKFITSSYNYFK